MVQMNSKSKMRWTMSLPYLQRGAGRLGHFRSRTQREKSPSRHCGDHRHGAVGLSRRSEGGEGMIVRHPLTLDGWDELERLFGPERGACAGCWSMWFKLPRSEWDAAGRAGRKAMFKALVEAGPPPGVLGYDGAVPVGWCA